MAYVEKVVTGLNCCLAVKNAGTETCFECPYKEQDGKDSTPCEDYLMQESLEIIREQVSLIHFLKHQRQKGHWVFGSSNGHSWMKCSQCLVSQDGQTACFSFCPNCGASMEEEPEHMT